MGKAMRYFKERRQGVALAGGKAGGMPGDQSAGVAGGIEPSATCADLVPLTTELLGSDKGLFKPVELRVITFWRQSGGDYSQFLDLVSGDMRMVSLLQTKRVRDAIGHMSGLGECMDLVASKDEVSMRMSGLMRNRELGSMTQLTAAEGLARLNGMYPDKGNGGVQVNIVFTGGLGD